MLTGTLPKITGLHSLPVTLSLIATPPADNTQDACIRSGPHKCDLTDSETK